jgi:hypothetical protein
MLPTKFWLVPPKFLTAKTNVSLSPDMDVPNANVLFTVNESTKSLVADTYPPNILVEVFVNVTPGEALPVAH